MAHKNEPCNYLCIKSRIYHDRSSRGTIPVTVVVLYQQQSWYYTGNRRGTVPTTVVVPYQQSSKETIKKRGCLLIRQPHNITKWIDCYSLKSKSNIILIPSSPTFMRIFPG